MTSDSDTCFFCWKGIGKGTGKLRGLGGTIEVGRWTPEHWNTVDKMSSNISTLHSLCLFQLHQIFFFQENPSFTSEFPVNQGFLFTPVESSTIPTNQTGCMRGRAGTCGGYQCLPCQASATSLQPGLFAEWRMWRCHGPHAAGRKGWEHLSLNRKHGINSDQWLK